MVDPILKQEAGMGSPTAEDDFDEAGDVEFYDSTIPGNPFGNMYLTRIPQYVWKAWQSLDEKAEFEIGKIRQWRTFDASGKPKDTLQLLLSSNLMQHQSIPKEYNLDITEREVKNTYVFSEQDEPSFVAKNKKREAALAQGIPGYLLRKQAQKSDHDKKADDEQQPDGRKSRRERLLNARRAVPKKTKLTGKIRHELSCTPMSNAETDHILTLRAIEAHKPKSKVTIMHSLPPNGLLDDRHFEGFIKTTDKPLTKVNRMDNKAARWSENVLMDAICRAFEKYNYWSMKALRAHIHQPEAYLREQLEGCAMLHRTGPFANQWSLKPDYKRMLSDQGRHLAQNDSAAPAVAEADAGDTDDDLEMEDVVVV